MPRVPKLTNAQKELLRKFPVTIEEWFDIPCKLRHDLIVWDCIDVDVDKRTYFCKPHVLKKFKIEPK